MSVASVAVSPVNEEASKIFGHSTGRHALQTNDSILIYLSVAGSMTRMNVLKSDSIASVKLRIQNFQGFFVKKQKLIFEGRELARSNSCMRDYGVTDGNILHLVLRLSDLLAVTVRTVCGKEYEFQVERNRNVGYVKQQIVKVKDFVDHNDQELVCDGEELDDQRLINDICNNNGSIHLLVRKSAKLRVKSIDKSLELSIEASVGECPGLVEAQSAGGCQFADTNLLPRNFLLEPLTVNSEIEPSLVIKELIQSTFNGLQGGSEPIPSSEGSGGAYFIQDSSSLKYVSVFKPSDEEPMAINNPRGLPMSTNGEGLKRGTRVGGGALREVAAYILDHPRSGPRTYSSSEKGFCGVPPTVMVKCLHSGFNHPDGYDSSSKNIKIGSLQMFVTNIGSCEDMGPRDFPVDQVHKISVLDIRLANADRHSGNILVKKEGNGGPIVLIPIDHGYCLPHNFEDCTFDWLYWPQSHQPYSPDTLDYIKSLDADRDIEMLKFYGWNLPPECARTLRISTMLLKKGAERGLTPFIIGSVMCREKFNKESVIERIVQEAEDAVLPGMSEVAFLESVSLLVDLHFDEMSK